MSESIEEHPFDNSSASYFGFKFIKSLLCLFLSCARLNGTGKILVVLTLIIHSIGSRPFRSLRVSKICSTMSEALSDYLSVRGAPLVCYNKTGILSFSEDLESSFDEQR